MLPIVAVIAAMVAWAALALATLETPNEDIPGAALFLFPAALAGIAMATRRITRAEQRFDLRSILLTGFSLRVIGMVARYWSPVDAFVYHREGIRIAAEIRAFDLYPETGQSIPGTGWIRYVSGVVHVFTWDDMISTFFVFTLFSFFGCYLLYRAFVHAVPDGGHKRYALLLFCWPSLCYWPSSIGKEAWMILGLGIVAWGVSRLLTHQLLPGIAVITLGLTVMSLARPHVALMVVAGIGVAMLARPGTRPTMVRNVGRLLAVGLLLIGGAIIAGQTAERLKIDNDGTEGISQALVNTSTQTSQGSGAFKPSVVRTPLDYPVAFVTVWFRPTPLEASAGGATQIASSLEGLLLLALVALSWPRLRSLPRTLLRVPYVTFAATYTLVFVYAFAAIGNFGILARQRTQGLVLLFVVLCAPILTSPGRVGLAERRANRAGRSRHRSQGAQAIDRARAERSRRVGPQPPELLPGGPRRRPSTTVDPPTIADSTSNPARR